jgi:hypothetical protein
MRIGRTGVNCAEKQPSQLDTGWENGVPQRVERLSARTHWLYSGNDAQHANESASSGRESFSLDQCAKRPRCYHRCAKCLIALKRGPQRLAHERLDLLVGCPARNAR